jgi:PAS domain S-box-containing protein
MGYVSQQSRWTWLTLILSSISIVALVFAFWELIENRFFHDLDYVSLHYLYISRGIASSVLLAMWAAWFVSRQRRVAEEQLRQSREHYRGLLEASPGAVVLYDRELRVQEWNAAAERLYGWEKAEVVERKLPTITPDHESKLQEWLNSVQAGNCVLDVETTRMDKKGNNIAVQLSLLPFREKNQLYFLEVTADIREKVRLRQRLIEIEKLTSMGQMAAGTAHHLNTPLGSMLLRVQMMRERVGSEATVGTDLERLEHAIGFCQQFVRRLLDFSRRPSAEPQPESVGPIVDAVLGFLAPPLSAKGARVVWEGGDKTNSKVMADRNELETLLLILLSNAIDAISPGGMIRVEVHNGERHVEITVTDNGCGIAAADQPRIFEPFFTTKPIGKGTGLGLAIAKNIVAEHGGEISLRSIPGEGTTALVLLPVCVASAAVS